MLRACVVCGTSSDSARCPAHRTRGRTDQATATPEHRRKRRALLAQGPPWTCHLCGDPITEPADMHADHLTPVAHGGEHGPVKPAHRYCNQAKGARA